jgi:hypothetical protein
MNTATGALIFQKKQGAAVSKPPFTQVGGLEDAAP